MHGPILSIVQTMKVPNESISCTRGKRDPKWDRAYYSEALLDRSIHDEIRNTIKFSMRKQIVGTMDVRAGPLGRASRRCTRQSRFYQALLALTAVSHSSQSSMVATFSNVGRDDWLWMIFDCRRVSMSPLDLTGPWLFICRDFI